MADKSKMTTPTIPTELLTKENAGELTGADHQLLGELRNPKTEPEDKEPA